MIFLPAGGGVGVAVSPVTKVGRKLHGLQYLSICTEALTFTESVIVKYVSQWTSTHKILWSYFTQQADMTALIILTWIFSCRDKQKQ